MDVNKPFPAQQVANFMIAFIDVGKKVALHTYCPEVFISLRTSTVDGFGSSFRFMNRISPSRYLRSYVLSDRNYSAKCATVINVNFSAVARKNLKPQSVPEVEYLRSCVSNREHPININSLKVPPPTPIMLHPIKWPPFKRCTIFCSTAAA